MNGFISYNSYKKENALNETYESFEELYELASDIYEQFTKKFSLKKIKSYVFYNIKKFIKYDYVMLKDFLDNTSIGIIYVKKRPDAHIDTGAFVVKKKSFKNTFNVEFIDDLTKTFDYIIVVYTMQTTTILHELQHTYDFYRSKNKYEESKKHKKHVEITRNYNVMKELLDKGVSGDKESVEKILQKMNRTFDDYYTSYVRQQDEISSHFVQTLPLLTFYVKTKGKRLMRNLDNVWYEFMIKYPGYNRLTPKQKKTLARKFSQYYYKVKEEVNAK